jgi:protein-S-isoprenylcysteine O-methyltransferase Ste14
MFTGIWQSAAILFTFIAFYVLDVYLMRRYDPLRAEGSSRAWDYTLFIVVVASLLILQPVLLPGLGLQTDAIWGLCFQLLGVALLLVSLTLHAWARTHLAQFYGEREEVQPGQYLVTSGPYAHVRHPIYTSYFVGIVGLFLVNPALPSLVVVGYAFVDFCLATRREERLLAEELPGYAEYMAQTPRFLPWLHRPARRAEHGR